MQKDLNFTKRQTPNGTKDYLPLEAKKKRYLEDEINAIFANWGYEEVITPTFEFFAALSVGTGIELQEKMYKFFDRQGHILALRPEMTAPIARLVANRLEERPKPLRLSYQSNVFKYEATQAGRQREFYQAGLELIGASEPLADAEIIAIVVEILQEVGLQNFSLDIGQIDYFIGLMKETDLSADLKAQLRRTLSDKDFVALKDLVMQADLTDEQQEAILTLPQLRGDREVLTKARQLVSNQQSKNALDNLAAIYDNLEALGVADYVNLDLSIIRGFNYYTGMVFEGYTQDLGFTICGGGRYDNLLEQFGDDAPATGFALGIDRLLLSLENQNVELPIADEQVYICYEAEEKQGAIKLAKQLRAKDQQVILEIVDRKVEESIEYGLERDYSQILYVGSEDQVEKFAYQVDTLQGIEVMRIQ
ncbi:MAG: ATP phosphoribosyltransferase regulatory subunit [Bacillota bacterium]